MGWGLHSHFCVQPNYSFEVVLWLSCVVVGVVTKIDIRKNSNGGLVLPSSAKPTEAPAEAEL